MDEVLYRVLFVNPLESDEVWDPGPSCHSLEQAIGVLRMVGHAYQSTTLLIERMGWTTTIQSTKGEVWVPLHLIGTWWEKQIILNKMTPR